MKGLALRAHFARRPAAFRRLAAVSCLVLLIAAAVFVHLRVADPHTPPPAGVAPPQGDRAVAEGGGRAAPDYREIAQWNLFGHAPEAPPPATDTAGRDAEPALPEDGPLPTSDAPITLTGVVYSPDGRAAVAIVSDAAKTDGTYAVGELLPGGIELIRIEPTRIVVARNGRLEEIPLPRLGEARGDSSRADAVSRREANPKPSAARPLANTGRRSGPG